MTAILMQDNFSEWPIYIPFIAYNENLLFLRENNLSLCLKLFPISSHDITDKMAASIESCCEMYKRSYLQTAQPIYIKFVAKCLPLLPHFTEVTV